MVTKAGIITVRPRSLQAVGLAELDGSLVVLAGDVERMASLVRRARRRWVAVLAPAASTTASRRWIGGSPSSRLRYGHQEYDGPGGSGGWFSRLAVTTQRCAVDIWLGSTLTEKGAHPPSTTQTPTPGPDA